MTTPVILLVVATAALAALYVALRDLVAAYLKFRGTRVVTCPETKTAAAVELDATRAALTAALPGMGLQVRQCSHWPERRDCVQACLAEIQLAPEKCLARTILAEWYRGKSCALCGKPFGEIDWLGHKPAFIGAAERRTADWREVRPEGLPEVLATHRPVCWNCHIAETFRREHPELVIDWPARSRSARGDVA